MTHKGTKVLHTERLTLRPFTTEDAQMMYDNWAKDERVTEFLTWPTHKSPETTKWVLKMWSEKYDSPGYYNWAIEYEGAPVGSISAVSMDEGSQWIELGYCIGYDWWGKGLISEAVKKVTEFFFREVLAHRVWICHAVENPASGKVAQKCGFTYEGTRKEACRSGRGIFHDVCDYGLIRSRWETL